MDLIDCHSELVFNALNLQKDNKVRTSLLTRSLPEGGEAHGEVLPQALELATYPIVRSLLAPLLLELVQCLLENVVGTNLFRFGFLSGRGIG